VTTGGIQAVIDRLPVARLLVQKGQGSRLLAQGSRSQAWRERPRMERGLGK